jgi:hypothetical protein
MSRIVLDLGATWRGAANTHHLPGLVVHLLEVFAGGHDPYGPGFKHVVEQELMEKIGKSLSNMRRKEVQKAIGEVCDELWSRWQATPPFAAGEFWDDFCRNQEIQWAIMSSQQMCYVAIYYAYENFLLQTYRLVSGKPDYRMHRAKEFGKDLAAAFDEEFCNYCWSDPDIRLAGMARNAFVHCGGRVTEELRKQNHTFVLQNDEIQIIPSNTKALYDLLKPRVIDVAKKSLARLGHGTAD